MKNIYLVLICILITSCNSKENADTIVINANIYTVNTNFEKAESFAIKNGKFIAISTSKEIQEKYKSNNIIDAKGKTIGPGFIDAHCHF